MVALRKCRRSPPAGFKYVPPDGGFGWLIVFGASLAGAIITVPLSSFGLIFVDILYDLKTTTSTASWIPSICLSASMLIAPVVNIVITKYSCRVATICGGILAAIGMGLSYFATNVIVLFMTFGVIYGAGFGFVVSATVLVLSDYFRFHYGLATGIAFACFAAGKLIFSPIVQMMLEHMDYHGLFLVLAALSLNVCVGGALFQPAHWHQKLAPIDPPPEATDSAPTNGVTDSSTNGTTNGFTKPDNGHHKNGDVTSDMKPPVNGSALTVIRPEERRPRSSSYSNGTTANDTAAVWLLQKKVVDPAEPGKATANLSSSWDIFGSVHSIAPRDDPKDMVKEKEAESADQGCYTWFRTGPLKLDVSLLSEPIFHVLMWSGMLSSVVSVYMSVYLPSLMVSNGLMPMQAAAVMSFKAGGEIAGRVVAPYVLSFFKIPLLPFYLGMYLVQVVLLILFTYMTSFGPYVAVVLLSGLVGGAYTGLIMLVYVDSIGHGRLSAIIALTKLLQGALNLGVGPIIGLVKDIVGGFDVCFYILAGLQFVCFAVWACQPLAKRKSFVT